MLGPRFSSRLSSLANWQGRKSYKLYKYSKIPIIQQLPSRVRKVPITPYLKKSRAAVRIAGYRGWYPKNRWQLAGVGAVMAARLGYSYWMRRRGRYRFPRRRRYRKFNLGKRSVGQPKNTSASKQYTTWNLTAVDASSRTLYNNEITDIPLTAGGSPIRYSREKPLVNINGLMLRVQVKNNLSVPTCFHLAVVQKKNGQEPVIDRFFRDMGNPSYPSGRGRDFNNTLTGTEMCVGKINTDEYGILYHGRFHLGPDGSGAGYVSTNKNNFVAFKKYIKIGRQFRYDDDSTIRCATPVYIVYWFDANSSPATSTPSANAFQISALGVVYFRESKAI